MFLPNSWVLAIPLLGQDCQFGPACLMQYNKPVEPSRCRPRYETGNRITACVCNSMRSWRRFVLEVEIVHASLGSSVIDILPCLRYQLIAIAWQAFLAQGPTISAHALSWLKIVGFCNSFSLLYRIRTVVFHLSQLCVTLQLLVCTVMQLGSCVGSFIYCEKGTLGTPLGLLSNILHAIFKIDVTDATAKIPVGYADMHPTSQ
jgi:hypothetical protein